MRRLIDALDARYDSHALPPGFVLKSEKKEEVANDTPLEELIEEQVCSCAVVFAMCACARVDASSLLIPTRRATASQPHQEHATDLGAVPRVQGAKEGEARGRCAREAHQEGCRGRPLGYEWS